MCFLLPLTLHFLCAVFSAELEKWRSPEFYEREVHRMQLPFSSKVPGGCVSVEERQERRAQQLRRLQEINARRREEKLQQDQERLDRLLAVQARTLLDLLKFTSTSRLSDGGFLSYLSVSLFVSLIFFHFFKRLPFYISMELPSGGLDLVFRPVHACILIVVVTVVQC